MFRRGVGPLLGILLGQFSLLGCEPHPTRPPEPEPDVVCSGFDETVAEYWSSEAKARVRAGIIAADADRGENLAVRVIARMDMLTHSWVATHEQACEQASSTSTAAYRQISACLRVNSHPAARARSP